MRQIFLQKHYGYYQQLTMDSWCKEHCRNGYHCGSPALKNCYAAITMNSEEIPWEFDSDEDAEIFESTWK
jgi:hypothetical protein